MKILNASYILTCNDKFELLKDQAICFDDNILDINSKDELIKKYPDAELINCEKNTVIMPGLVNPHVHLEFSANQSSLVYGDFIIWLNSVISKRDDLLSLCSDEIIENQLDIMRKSGTTSLGAISSFGNDFDACLNTPQRVVFFTELLGSQPNSVDILFNDFKSRLRVAEDNESKRLIPAISIHSPYSTHPILARNALDIARKNKYVVSTHFMESVAEREWLDSGKGDFNEFFSNFAANSKPMSDAYDFIDLFYGCKTLFTHCVQAKKSELEKIEKMGGSVTNCLVSNRLLGVGKLDITNIENLTIGTDGLSSNISLNLWDEMRAILFSNEKIEINTLAKKVLKAVTSNGANALNLNCGEITKGKYADLIVCKLPDDLENIDNIPLELILHTKQTEKTYIGGEEV